MDDVLGVATPESFHPKIKFLDAGSIGSCIYSVLFRPLSFLSNACL
jgi:hypothetical protein